MCSFCCVASVVKSLVSVSFSLAFFSTKYRSSQILFHTLLTFMHMSCSSRTKHHKHKLDQHLYSYILQNKWHYKTCLANTNCKSQWHYGLRSTVGRCLPNTQTICTIIMRTLKLCKHLVAYCKCGNALSRTSLNRPSLDANYDYRNDYRPDDFSLPPPDLRSAFRLAFVSS